MKVRYLLYPHPLPELLTSLLDIFENHFFFHIYQFQLNILVTGPRKH